MKRVPTTYNYYDTEVYFQLRTRVKQNGVWKTVIVEDSPIYKLDEKISSYKLNGINVIRCRFSQYENLNDKYDKELLVNFSWNKRTNIITLL